MSEIFREKSSLPLRPDQTIAAESRSPSPNLRTRTCAHIPSDFVKFTAVCPGCFTLFTVDASIRFANAAS